MSFKTLFENEDTKYDLINYWSTLYELPTSLVMAIIAQESSFNSYANKYEPKLNDNSYGLCQILHTTAQDLGFNDLPEKLYDDNINLKFALKFLSNKYIKYNKNIKDTISAYNAGYSTKQKDDTYLNQDYVNKVLSYYAFYNAKYNEINEPKTNALYDMIINKQFSKIGSLDYEFNPTYKNNKNYILPIILISIPILAKIYKSF